MLHFARWKIILVLIVSIGGILAALPNLLSPKALDALPGWIPHKQVNLGLDLQGGAHLLYQMDERELVRDWLKNIRGDVRDALRKAKIGYRLLKISVPSRTVSVRIRKPEDFDRALTRLRDISVPLSSALAFTGQQGNTIDVTRGEGGQILLKITDQGLFQRIGSAIEASIETVRRRIDAFGTTEPTIQRQGRGRILVQVPGIKDVSRLKALVGETGKLEFRLVDTTSSVQQAQQSGRPPPGTELVASEDGFSSAYLLKSRAIVTGESLVDAQPGFDQRTNEPVVTFRFDTAGARRFGRVTQSNVGRPFAIVLDNKVISAPVIREPILGGTGQISGSFTVQQANDMSVLLRSGALPAKLTILEERTVGASLGADSIAAGEIAALIGLLAVIVFILISYGLFGVFANLALAVNIALIIGVLSLLQATLTLPGIAGIVLTIGMAVDANVLIFERIREESRAGKSVVAAIDSGYSRALGTILDANITTFIAALVLFWLGSGPIRGFAVTLSIGVITSVFTAFTLTRLMVAQWVRLRRPQEVPI
ncbi:MAG TPA: protein translocase subunit SecD [Rhizobiales bacterium]|nr:preprotein translocase subunit SecD [bacterium BMS3Bbin10]HDO52890.1 protein translocase subunit SecD [Hyphomicrobiales bacterium]